MGLPVDTRYVFAFADVAGPYGTSALFSPSFAGKIAMIFLSSPASPGISMLGTNLRVKLWEVVSHSGHRPLYPVQSLTSTYSIGTKFWEISRVQKWR